MKDKNNPSYCVSSIFFFFNVPDTEFGVSRVDSSSGHDVGVEIDPFAEENPAIPKAELDLNTGPP